MAEPKLLAALGLMAASGFSALGLQIVWTQQSATWLGHEAAGMLGVVTAFFGGLALGALAFGPRIQRSRRPLRWYVGCEAVVAAWALLLGLLITPASSLLMALTGAQPSAGWQWSVAFAGTLLLLLPATAAMGATLPAMERLLARAGRTRQPVAALYAANTFGAVAGVLAAAFWLVPAWGLSRTAAACAALSLASAAAAWWALGDDAVPGAAAQQPKAAGSASSASQRLLVLRLAATGCLGIGYQVLMVRALSQVAENTVYTFALLLAVYLVGTAVGAAVLHRVLRGRAADPRWTDRLLCGLALACLLGTASLWALAPVHAALRGAFGDGMAAALAAEAALALMTFGAPTLVMGALFSLLAQQAAAQQAPGPGLGSTAGLGPGPGSGSGLSLGLGRALGINTLGAALGPLLVGVLLLPAVGLKMALMVLVAGYLALSSRMALRAPPTWGVAGAALALAAWAPPLVTVDVPPGGRLVSHQEGVLAAVSVVEDAAGAQWLHIDNREPEGSSVTALADGRQALLPLLLHPAPQRALFLGLGTGVTAATAAEDRALHVDAVELLPEVVRAAALFTPALAPGVNHPRLTVHVADARRFVRAAGPAYDLVVSDNFHPARSGSAALYTAEHFAAVQARLAPGGLFCQWLPLHQMDLDTLRSIVRTFTAVYPQAWAMLATNSLDTPVLGLVARQGAGRVSLAATRQRLAGALLERSPAEWGVDDELALLGSIVAGPAALRRWSAVAPLNTDDHPLVGYLAPRITYAPATLPRERLLQWLAEVSVEPGEVVDTDSDADAGAGMGAGTGARTGATTDASTGAGTGASTGASTGADAARLRNYRAARLLYLNAGRGVRPTADVRLMLQQVQAPLLAALQLSPDFRPAYEPLLRMAQALGRTDPAAAAALLRELHRLQPAWPQAQEALRTLPFGAAPG
ncbi:MAG: spermidine synthase [Rubrivivax sp.]|nr:spermidine synthase [Rubrivivax sp.]